VDRKLKYAGDNLLRRGYLVEKDGALTICSSSFADFIRKHGGGGGSESRLSSLLGRLRRRS
jgi:hypothetical protein